MGQLIPIIDIAANTDSHLAMLDWKATPLRTFDGDIFEVFETSRCYQPDEEFTFTFRVSLDLESEKGQVERENLCAELRTRFPEEAEALIALLDENEWDVSFFADYF